jgi:hypothetical protein
MYHNIPDELKGYPNWIVWRLVDRPNQKPTKVPLQARNGFPADVTNPSHWCSYDEAVAAAPNATGIGFVFADNCPYTGIDLDDTHGDKEAYERQLSIFRLFNSYSELSPSGSGVHIIVLGKTPTGRRRSDVEVYPNGRFFTMTGNVINNVPIADRQDLLLTLYEEMGGDVQIYDNYEDQAETEDDDVIIARALDAANGDKFQKLLAGDWQGLYPSQSEADMAFVDIVGFYCKNNEQIRRIFRASALGQTPKDNYEHRGDRHAYVNYMIRKCRDRELPPIDVDGLKIMFEKMRDKAGAELSGGSAPAANGAASSVKGNASTAEGNHLSHDASSNATAFPPGLIGEVAEFILAAAPRPVPHIALTAAIGFLAGICGRAYNISGTGLNQYIIQVAKTGRGKEAVASGISKLIEAMGSNVIAIRDFVGPTEIQSSPGLLKWLAEKPCCYSIVGEFGLKLREMSNPNANAHTSGLLRTYLDLYNKSGRGNIVGALAYSDKQNNTPVIHSPGFTLIGETTPSRLYDNVNEAMIADGLLPRFMVRQYDGPRTQFNEHHKEVYPSIPLIGKLNELASYCLGLMHNNQVLEVPIDSNAKAILNNFNTFCDAQINNEDQGEVAHELWNRAHIKALKLAALYAVGWNYVNPIITEPMAIVATNEIAEQTWQLKNRFDKGEVGSAVMSSEAKQIGEVIKIISTCFGSPYEKYSSYGDTMAMWKDNVISYSHISRRLIASSIFRNDRIGATAAIKRTIQTLLDTEELKEMPKVQMQTKYGRAPRSFVVANPERFV